MKEYTAPHLTVDEFDFSAEVVASTPNPVYNYKNVGPNNQNCVQNDPEPGFSYQDHNADYVCA